MSKDIKKKAIEKLTESPTPTVKGVCTACEGTGIDKQAETSKLCDVCQGSGSVAVKP